MTQPLVFAADVVMLARHGDELQVLLIERGWPPYEGRLALPGGHVDGGEDFEAAAQRELLEETGVTAARLDRVGTYDAPGRDPRGRYVSVAFLAVLDEMPTATPGDDANAAAWHPVDEVLANRDTLAFDHARILVDALAHAST